MEYNKTRSPLVMREYGRNIQKMSSHILSIDDKEKRTIAAKTIVQIMSQMNPQIKETMEYKHKLWDHLHVITNYQLEVDSPYEKPIPIEKEAIKKLAYSDKKNINFKHYGKTIQCIIEKAIEMPEGKEKEYLIITIANYMKKSYIQWNKNSISDEIIQAHLTELSHGKLQLPETFQLSNNHEHHNKGYKKPFNKQNKPYSNNKFNNNNNNNNKQKRKRVNP